MKIQPSGQPSLHWVLHTQDSLLPKAPCTRSAFACFTKSHSSPSAIQRNTSGVSTFLATCYTISRGNPSPVTGASMCLGENVYGHNSACSQSTISIFINLRERRRNKSCRNVKIIREETFPGNKHGPHCTEGRTNKLWGGYGAVKSLFTSEERNKVGGKPLGLHINKSSSRGWGRRAGL